MKLLNAVNHFFNRFSRRVDLHDLISCRNHSRDFTASRAEYLVLRVRLVAFLFTLLSLLWIPVDYLTVDGEAFLPLLLLRGGFAGGFLLLGIWGGLHSSIVAARTRLLLFSLIPGLFYLGSQLILDGNGGGVLLYEGYSFLPYLMISLLAIAPLTLLEGILFSGVVVALYLLTETIVGRLLTLETLTHIWLMLLLAGLAAWVQLSQLHMLLMLYREATRDFLTGLVNRRVLLGWLTEEIVRERDEEPPLGLLLFDLDLFKRINDTHGHLTGDEVLKRFAQLLTETIGERGMVGRYGGEEFLAILPNCGAVAARRIAEQIREACEGLSIDPLGGGDSFHFTTSIGVGTLRGDESAEALISRVDVALYAAKRSGRNLVAEAD